MATTTMDMPIKPIWYGAIWFLFGTGIFSFVFISGKILAGEISIYQLMFLRYLSGFITIILLTRIKNISVRSSKPSIHLFRAIFGAGGALCIIYATANMPVTDATAISLLEGVITVILSVMFFKDHLSIKQYFALMLCIFGAFVMVIEQGLTGGQGWDYWMPACISFLSAILIAFEGVLLKKIAMREKSIPVLFHVNGFAMILLAIPAYLTWQSIDIPVLIFCFFIGVAAIFAQFCNIQGYRITPIYVAGMINYTWIIFAAIWGMALFDEALTMIAAFGAIAILLGGIGLVKTNVK